MLIRRLFGFCASHLVRNCTSRRCATSIHGHNYKIEVFVEADGLDNGGMILDFGIFKNQIADFIDGFDHAHHFWDKENPDFVKFITENSARYVKLQLNPSAESYALIFLYYLNKILQATSFCNDEFPIRVSSVRVHETDNGYAEAFLRDLENPNFSKYLNFECVEFSKEIMNEWKNPNMFSHLKEYLENPNSNLAFKNPSPLKQL